jgi:hypothetical protein
LSATYFGDIALTTPSLARVDPTINFDWGAGSPGDGIPADHFSARWTRSVQLAAASYAFTVTSDDGVRLYVDDGATAIPQILRVLDAASVETGSIELHRPSLDDVVLTKTGRSLRES